MNAHQIKKLVELIAQWRQASNEALTGDSASTYTECADALEATYGIRFLSAVCEGCGTTRLMPTINAYKVYADLPDGWTQTGKSKHAATGQGVRLAAWCQTCRVSR